MTHVNTNKLLGKMTERGYNQTTLSKELNISRATLKSYIDTPEKMPYGIISALAAKLCDDVGEATTIFFEEDLRSA